MDSRYCIVIFTIHKAGVLRHFCLKREGPMKDILLIWYSSLTAFFLTLEMSVQIHCFWPPVSDQKSAVSLTEDPRYMLSQFSLAALEILFIIRFQTFEFPYASLWVYLTWSSLRFLGVYVTVSQHFQPLLPQNFSPPFFFLSPHTALQCVYFAIPGMVSQALFTATISFLLLWLNDFHDPIFKVTGSCALNSS